MKKLIYSAAILFCCLAMVSCGEKDIKKLSNDKLLDRFEQKVKEGTKIEEKLKPIEEEVKEITEELMKRYGEGKVTDEELKRLQEIAD